MYVWDNETVYLPRHVCMYVCMYVWDNEKVWMREREREREGERVRVEIGMTLLLGTSNILFFMFYCL